jgi:16S rRNA (guanine1207-N2)-methyltransferase
MATEAGQRYVLATKAGLLGHGHDDVASRLLAEHVPVAPGSTVVQMQCGAGFFGAVAAVSRRASHVWLTDRSAIGVEAARRTMALNAITNATVIAGHGSAALDPALRSDVVALRIPTEKQALLQLLADAFGILRVGGSCAIAGATNEGIKSAAHALEALFGNVTVLATERGHRVVMSVKRAPTVSDTTLFSTAFLAHDAFHPLDVIVRGVPLALCSRPGVFSWEHLDEATALLADVMDVRAGDRVLDLGCGTGALGLRAAQLSGAGHVTLLDVDLEAVRCVERSIHGLALHNCSVLGSDVGAAVNGDAFDLVVTNPPFHVGKATALDVPAQFIRDAWRVLRVGGRLALVANRTLPYERLIDEQFGTRVTIHDGPRFKVLGATK